MPADALDTFINQLSGLKLEVAQAATDRFNEEKSPDAVLVRIERAQSKFNVRLALTEVRRVIVGEGGGAAVDNVAKAIREFIQAAQSGSPDEFQGAFFALDRVEEVLKTYSVTTPPKRQHGENGNGASRKR